MPGVQKAREGHEEIQGTRKRKLRISGFLGCNPMKNLECQPKPTRRARTWILLGEGANPLFEMLRHFSVHAALTFEKFCTRKTPKSKLFLRGQGAMSYLMLPNKAKQP